MKFFPFLFLLSFACEAQDYVFIDTNAVKELGATISRIKNATQQWAEREGTKTLSLEEKLLLYAQECWNDSSKYCYYIWCDGTCHEVLCDCNSINGRGNVMIGITCKTKYIHRTPTFEGFIEWLRKKQ